MDAYKCRISSQINTSLNDSSDSETSLEPSSILDKNTVSTIETNTVSNIETNTSSLPTDTSSNHTRQYETPLEPSSTIETNTSLPPATPITMITLLSELHPRKYKRAAEIESEWCDTNPKNISIRQHQRQTKSLTEVLQVLSEKNPSFASDLINAVKDANPILNAELSKRKDKSDDINDTIVNSIKSFLHHKLVKVKTKEEKEAFNVVLQACTYMQSDSVNLNTIRNFMGVSTASFYKNVNSQRNEGELVKPTNYQHKKRKTITRTLLRQLQIQSVKEFCHSDESSTIDSNSKRLVEVKSDDKVEKHVGRVWIVSTIDEQHALFLESETVQTYLQLHPTYKPPSRSYFYDLRCPCLALPTIQSCINIWISSAQQYMRAISKYIRTNKTIKDALTSTSWVRLLTGHVDEFIDSVCCQKVPHPELVCGVGLSKRIPSFIPWSCLHGDCANCGIEKVHKISENKCLMKNKTIIHLLEWKDIPRQGLRKDGKPNTQLELTRTQLPVDEVMVKLLEQLVICRKHIGRYRWINHCRKLDYTMSDPDRCQIICTNFGATFALCAAVKDNSSVDNHADICIFFVLTNWRNVRYLKK